MATWPTITDDDGSNTTGTVVNNANVWTPIQTYVGGAWSNVTFSAGNFTASGSMTWTVESGDVTSNRYVVCGKTLFWSLFLGTTTIGGTPSTALYITLPGGLTAASTVGHYVRLAYCNNNGSVVEAMASMHSSTQIKIELTSGANWATGTNNNYCYVQFVCEIT